MSDLQLYQNIATLPPPLQKEVADFVAFLYYKHQLPIVPKEDTQRLPLKFGAGKDLITFVADDFDAPLDHFKEYTQ